LLVSSKETSRVTRKHGANKNKSKLQNAIKPKISPRTS
jgi:hypothetical protein